MKERRQSPRHEMELPATLRTNGKLIPAATLDISRGGVCLLTDYDSEVKPGEAEVVLDLSPGVKDISLKGTILRLEKEIGQKVALRFSEKDSLSLKKLGDFLPE